jgi:hypothetical protein
MRTYGTLLVGVLALLFICPAAYSQCKCEGPCWLRHPLLGM